LRARTETDPAEIADELDVEREGLLGKRKRGAKGRRIDQDERERDAGQRIVVAGLAPHHRRAALDDMGELVREQAFARGRVRGILAAGEGDVRAGGEGPRLDRARRGVRSRSVVDLDVVEAAREPPFEEIARRRIERAPGLREKAGDGRRRRAAAETVAGTGRFPADGGVLFVGAVGARPAHRRPRTARTQRRKARQRLLGHDIGLPLRRRVRAADGQSGTARVGEGNAGRACGKPRAPRLARIALVAVGRLTGASDGFHGRGGLIGARVTADSR
jgi:hypothetical protein